VLSTGHPPNRTFLYMTSTEDSSTGYTNTIQSPGIGYYRVLRGG